MASPPSPKPLIVARNLTRIYAAEETRVVGLSGLDLDVFPGELIVVKGVSGSGKSTLLALLAGLDRPTSGTLTVAGLDLVSASPESLTQFRRRQVGMIFQAFNLLPTLTVFENVCLPVLLAGKDPSRTKSEALQLLRKVDMDKRRHHRPGELSGGEMQRTAIARALINDPRIILADEPTGNLDSSNSRTVIRLLVELNRRENRTILIATHADLADPYASRILRLEDGRLI